jgi:Asp/Glu/hydantoin racemase
MARSSATEIAPTSIAMKSPHIVAIVWNVVSARYEAASANHKASHPNRIEGCEREREPAEAHFLLHEEEKRTATACSRLPGLDGCRRRTRLPRHRGGQEVAWCIQRLETDEQ